MHKMTRLFFTMLFVFVFFGLTGCTPSDELNLDSLDIEAMDAIDVPAGTYTVLYTIEDLNEYVAAYDLIVTIEVIDQDGSALEVSNATFTIIPGNVYTVTITAWVDNEIVRNKIISVTAIANTVVSVAVSSLPAKIAYVVGESFDATGMVLTATYADGSTAITNEITYSQAALSTTDQSITITHTPSGLTAVVTITVQPPVETFYSVTFNGGGGQLMSGDELQSVRYGEAAQAPVYQKKDCTFNGFDVAFDYVTSDLTVTALWIDPSQGTAGLSYDLDNFTYTYAVSGYWGSATTVVVPATHNGYPVTRIGNNAFLNNTTIHSLDLPSSIISIGIDPFSGASNLTEIRVASTNPAYTSVNGVLYDASISFLIRVPQGYDGLVQIPEGVKKLATSAMNGCRGVTDIDFPDSLYEIPANAFYQTAWLDGQPDGLLYAGKVAYLYRGAMPVETTITLIPGTIGIGDEAFAFQENLVDIVFSDSLIHIGAQAFADCDQLNGLIFPAGLHSIGTKAFEQCDGLTDIYIPDGLKRLGDRAFYATAWYQRQPDGLVYLGQIAYTYKGVMPEGTVLSLRSGTTGIADYAFYQADGSTALQSILLPASLLSIGEGAFGGCTGLTMLLIPGSVESIGGFAFINTIVDLYAEVSSEPSTWNDYWNITSRPVFWNCMNVSSAIDYSFDTMGGNPIDPIQTVFLSALPVPVRLGFDFLGWYEDAGLSGTPVNAPYYPESKSDTTLYAKWELSVYQVEFITDGWTLVGGGDRIQNVHYGEAVNPPLISLDGTLFVGWDADLDGITSSIQVHPIYARITASTSVETSEGVWISCETSHGGNVEINYGNGVYTPFIPGSRRYLVVNTTILARISYQGGLWITFPPFVIDNIDFTHPTQPQYQIRQVVDDQLHITIIGGIDTGSGVLRHEYRIGDEEGYTSFTTSSIDLIIPNGTIVRARTIDLAENSSIMNETWVHVDHLTLTEDSSEEYERFVVTSVQSPTGSYSTTNISLSGAFNADSELYRNYVSYSTGYDYRGCGVNAGLIYLEWFGQSLPISFVNDYVETTDFGKYLEWLTENTWADPSIFTTPAQLVTGLQDLIDLDFSGYEVVRRSPNSTASAIAMIESSLSDGFPVAILVNDGGHWQIISESIVIRDAEGEIVSAKFLTHDNGGAAYRSWSQLDYFFEDNWDAELARKMDYTSYVDTIISIRRNDAIQTQNWSSGWSSAEFFEVEGNAYVFLTKNDETVHVNHVNTDGTIGAIAQTYSWSDGWDNVSFYQENGTTYLVLFKSSNQLLHIRTMNADGSIGAITTDRTFPGTNYNDVDQLNAVTLDGNNYLEAVVHRSGDDPALDMIYDLLDGGLLGDRLDITIRYYEYGFTQATIYEAYGESYTLHSDSSSGLVFIYAMDENHKFGERVARYQWSEGWTTIIPFTIDGESYLFLAKMGYLSAGGIGADEYGLVRIHRINPDGTIGVIVDRTYWPPLDNLFISIGYNIVRFYQNAVGETFLFALRENDGRVMIYRITADGRIDSSLR